VSGLGRLIRITDLRKTWPDEARDFTPWLARPENLAVLSEHLGLGPEGLELEAVEKFVGPYKADILCRDTTAGNWVLIENQLEKTDHSHLGQLLVYAAGLDCKTIIWISKSVTPEHRFAIEWLNAMSTAGTSFYALEIELWQIGDSAIAPSFNTVVRPNDSARQAETAKSSLVDQTLSPARQELFEFWKNFEEHLAARRGAVRAVSPLAQNWLVHSIGKAGVGLNTSWNRREGWVRAEIYLTGLRADDYFKQLLSQKDAVEVALGEPLQWYDGALSDRRIYLSRQFKTLADRSQWPAQHEWLVEAVERLHDVFHDRIRSLQ
jgi:Domain of unknown function (DUF4268)